LRTILQEVFVPVIRDVSEGPLVETSGILQDRFLRVVIIFFLHRLVVESDAAMGSRVTGEVPAMDPEGDVFFIDVKPKGIIHRIEDLRVLHPIEGRPVILMIGRDPEFPDGGLVSRFPRGDRRGKDQVSLFVYAQELLREIHQDELVQAFGGGIGFRHGGETDNRVQILGDLQGDAGIDVAAVDPVEAGHVLPTIAKEFFQVLPGSDPAAFPGDSFITGVMDLAQVRGGVG
jgi:hypothetical protein